MTNFTQLNNYLTRYIKVHDQVLVQRLGQQLDHAELLSELKDVSDSIKSVDDEFKDELVQKDYGVVSNYINQLLEAIGRLIKIVTGLKIKADNIGKYGWIKYQRDLKEYKLSVNNYMLQGEALNDLMSK